MISFMLRVSLVQSYIHEDMGYIFKIKRKPSALRVWHRKIVQTEPDISDTDRYQKNQLYLS